MSQSAKAGRREDLSARDDEIEARGWHSLPPSLLSVTGLPNGARQHL